MNRKRTHPAAGAAPPDPAGIAASAGSAAAANVADSEAVVAAEIKVEQAVRKIDMPEPEAIDLLEHAGSPVLKRAVPVLGVAIVVFVLWRVLRRRK